MKAILAICLMIELLFLGAQAASTHFQFHHEAIPYFGIKIFQESQGSGSSSSSLSTKKKKRRKKSGSEDNSVENFEQMRKGQMAKLDLIKDLHPMAESSGSPGESKPPLDLSIPLPPPPANLMALKQVLMDVFWTLEPKMGLVWFKAHLNFPTVIRILFYIPPILFPWLLLLDLFSRKSSKGEYHQFLKSLRGIWFLTNKPYRNFDQAYTFWKKPTIQGQFQRENRTLRKKWFRALIQEDKRHEALNFGAVLFNEDRKDTSFAQELCVEILNGEGSIDRKYSALLTWYLSKKGNAENAWLIFQKCFAKVAAGDLDRESRRLLRMISTLSDQAAPRQLLGES
jgi:hypothetical protein